MTIVTDYLLDVSAGGGLEARVGRHYVMSDQPGAAPHQPLEQQQQQTQQRVKNEDARASVGAKPSLGDEPSPCSSNPTSPTPEGTTPVTAVPSRRSLKNEDSSYDSDFESSEVLGPASTASGPEDTPGADEQHDYVTRTVSDTLAAEFAEYVTMQPNTSTTHVLPTATSKTIVTTHEVTTTTSCSSSASVAVPTPLISSSAASQMPGKSGDSKDAAVHTSVKDSAVVSAPSNKESLKPTPTSAAKSDPEVTAQSSASTKCPLTATASLPSHSILTSKNSSSGVIIRPHVSVASSLCSRPSSAPVTQSLVRSASAAIASSEIPTSVGGGQSWSGSDSSVYSQQVEFGIKLGYSESLVQLALKKLGDKPAKNELLDELIRLGAVMPKAESELDAPVPASSEGEEAKEADPSLALRPIIIDGSNVAMSHGNKNVFSCRGLRVCVDWFRERGHKDIIVFVPAWRKESSRWDAQITDQQLLDELEQQKVLVFTPSRTGHTGGRRIIPYDDRYILNEAVLTGGVVVSNDNFRDLAGESAAFRRVVEEALLMYSWVNGRFVPPDDPLGRNGPTLDAFLRRPVPNTPQARDLGLCPYGKKCTYGNKCKYQHPERGTQPIKSVTERLQEHREKHYLDKATKSRDSSPGETLRGSYPLPTGPPPATSYDRGPGNGKKPLSRTLSTHATTSAMTLSAALVHETPPLDSRSTPTPGSPASPGPCTSTAATTTPAPAGAPLLTQQHMMLSAQPSYDQTTLQQQQRSHDAFKSQMFKSESCLYPLFTSQPHQLQQQHLHHQASSQQQQPQSLVGSKLGVQPYQQAAHPSGWTYPRAQEACEASGNVFGEHVIVERQASDPESAVTSDNAHPKLRRQLTLNPSNDHRLAKMTKDATHQKSLPIGHFGAVQQNVPPQYQQLHGISVAGNQHFLSQQQFQGSVPPFSPYSSDQKHLQQNPSGQGSSSGTVSQSSHPSHLYQHHHHPQQQQHQHQQQQHHQQQQQHHHHQPQQGTHPHVARFSSAPDPIGGNSSACNISSQYGHVPAGITRLNSTSDPHLNLYGSTESPHYLSEPYDEVAQCRTPYFASHHNITGGPNPASQTPVGSRPLSPQQSLLQQQQQQPPRNLAMQSTVASVLNTSFPPPKSTGKQEERTRLYYHLINLFPEEIVLVALAQHPNETDVRKICSSILDFSGSDASASTAQQHPLGPVSQQLPPSLMPSQQQSPSIGRPHLSSCQSVPLPIRVPSPSDSQTTSVPFSSVMAMPHENSRLREYMNPQASFMDTDAGLRSLVSPMTSLASGGVAHPQQQLQQQQQQQQQQPPPPGQLGMHFNSQSHDAT